jgi:hypothetical protein
VQHVCWDSFLHASRGARLKVYYPGLQTRSNPMSQLWGHISKMAFSARAALALASAALAALAWGNDALAALALASAALAREMKL